MFKIPGTMVLIVIKIIINTGATAAEAVSSVAGKYGLSFQSLWDKLPRRYK